MSLRTLLRGLVLVCTAAALVGWVTDWFHPVYPIAPLVGVAILWAGHGFLASLGAGAGHVPTGEAPQVLDTSRERTTFRCEGCGAEVLLLVRGTPTPPRHCGERMVERREVARGR